MKVRILNAPVRARCTGGAVLGSAVLKCCAVLKCWTARVLQCCAQFSLWSIQKGVPLPGPAEAAIGHVSLAAVAADWVFFKMTDNRAHHVMARTLLFSPAK
jgi:hypothetical protein